MELKLSIKQVLLDLLSIWVQVQDHFKEHPKYETLVNYLSEKDYYNDDDLYIPTLTEISKQTGIKSHHLRKQLKEMYDNFFDFETGRTLDFSNTEIWFNVEYFKRYACYRSHKLTYIPRIGENITVPFLRAKVGIDSFYVQDIRHQFYDSTHLIDIDLKGGYFNSYWYFRKHEGMEKGEIGFGIDHKYYEWQVKEMLGLRR